MIRIVGNEPVVLLEDNNEYCGTCMNHQKYCHCGNVIECEYIVVEDKKLLEGSSE